MNEAVYQVITDRIISLLEQGTVPWQRGWTCGDHAPQNLISGQRYHGINVFLLNAMHYSSPFWVTFRQAQELGGHVKKGEKSCPVIFWKWLEVDDRDTGDKKRIPLLRYYSVFNVTQCDGIPSDKIPALEASKREHDPISEAERIVANMPNKPQILHGGNRACYVPNLDRVEIPKPEDFRSGEDYYATLDHELIHSTAHSTRLNRTGVIGNSRFGSNPYAREELVAEMGAAFLCGEAGIVERTIQNSASYIDGWLQRLRDDSSLVVQAASAAQKAADYILNRKAQERTTESQPEAMAA